MIDVLKRIKAARADRDRHAEWLNEALRLAMPTYRRIAGSQTTEDRTAEQDDLFDTTLQVTTEDFASDMIDTFTPRHSRWVTFEPAEDLTEGQRREIGAQLQGLEDSIFADIERSNYWDAAQECFQFWGVSTMAAAVSARDLIGPIEFQPIEIADLLIERGPDGSLIGRWREMKLDQMGLHIMWPGLYPMPAKTERRKRFTVYEGCDRDHTVPGEERWTYRIFVDDKEKVAAPYQGPGSCPMIVCRFRQQADSAWGPGPTHKAVPMARTLDELAYLNLKALQRSVDPPGTYEEDGVINLEGGMQAGVWTPRAAGSGKPEALTTDVRFDALVFNVDELRRGVKKALYQDRPEQPGKTPPTLGQWDDEKVWNTRRRELPRDRCVRDWVLPIIERVAWIKKQRGELPEIKLQGGRLISVRPVSPLSKAKDLEDIQITSQIINLANQLATAVQGMPAIDARSTMLNLIATAKERHIVLLTEEQMAEAAEIAMAKATVDDAGLAGALAGGAADA